jgi:hypothetical protein
LVIFEHRDEFYSKYKKLSDQPNERKSFDSTLTIDEVNQDQNQQQSTKKTDSLLYSSYKTKSSKNRAITNSSAVDGPRDVAPKKDMYSVYEGYRFPNNLNNPWAVSKVLIQTKGKMSLRDLKSSAKTSIKLTAQAKVKQPTLNFISYLENSLVDYYFSRKPFSYNEFWSWKMRRGKISSSGRSNWARTQSTQRPGKTY